MSKFTKEGFEFFGGYLTYGPDKRFVARFKYRGGATKLGEFKAFLIKNVPVEEYFEAYKQGLAPLTIAFSRGFVPKWYRENNVTPLV